MKKQILLVLEILCGIVAIIALVDLIASLSVNKGSSTSIGIGGVVFWGLMFFIAWNARKKAIKKADTKNITEAK